MLVDIHFNDADDFILMTLPILIYQNM